MLAWVSEKLIDRLARPVGNPGGSCAPSTATQRITFETGGRLALEVERREKDLLPVTALDISRNSPNNTRNASILVRNKCDLTIRSAAYQVAEIKCKVKTSRNGMIRPE
jgi:hypothetical protein